MRALSLEVTKMDLHHFCASRKQGETGLVLSVYKVGFKVLLCPLTTGTSVSTCRRGGIAVTSHLGLAQK